jgi:hypothetical protein
MPTIQKIFTIEVTPEKFLEYCSQTELMEVDMLLNSERFQRRIKGNIGRCLSDDHGCIYHACMSNDCQKPGMIERGYDYGKGNCEKFNN